MGIPIEIPISSTISSTNSSSNSSLYSSSKSELELDVTFVSDTYIKNSKLTHD